MGLLRALVFLPVLLVASSREAAAPAPFRCAMDEPAAAWPLPGRLEEISGLAAAPDGRVLAHADEEGRVFELDPATGEVGREIRLRGRPRDDFEGIAATPGGFVLMTSAGRLYVVEPADSGDAGYQRVETGLGRFCELEGLAFDAATGVLLLPCKTARDPRLLDAVTVFRWELATGRLAAPPRVVIPAGELRRVLGGVQFRATGVEFDPATRRLLLLSSAPRVVLEVDSTGRIVNGAPLAARRHPLPEGIALRDGQLLIGDEAADRDRRGRLTVYSCAP